MLPLLHPQWEGLTATVEAADVAAGTDADAGPLLLILRSLQPGAGRRCGPLSPFVAAVYWYPCPALGIAIAIWCCQRA